MNDSDLFIHKVLFLLILLVNHLPKTDCSKKHVGLIASTGAYSHDKMMQRVADSLGNEVNRGYRVTWIQIRVFEFNLTRPNWTYQKTEFNGSNTRSLVVDSCSPKSSAFLKWTQNTLWKTSFPADWKNPASALTLLRIHAFHMTGCKQALESNEFLQNLYLYQFDAIVLDYMCNECGSMLAHGLNAPIIYLSNYPLPSSYVEYLSVPNNPSVVPSLLGPLPSKMTFLQRIENLLYYELLRWARLKFFDSTYKTFYASIRGNSLLNGLPLVESRALFIGTPLEGLLESPRPITNRLRYLGCPHCIVTHKQNLEDTNSINEILQIDTSSKSSILVSFGSVLAGNSMPKYMIDVFLDAFQCFQNTTIIWQFGQTSANLHRPLPNNVYLVPWLPLHKLLGDSSVKLLITHGGITTSQEAVHRNVPILGIPIQGDQPYILRRLVDRGLASMLSNPRIQVSELATAIDHMLNNYNSYHDNVIQFGSMLSDVYKLWKDKSATDFWIDWSINHGHQLDTYLNNSTGRFLEAQSYNLIKYYCLDVVMILIILPITILIILIYLSRIVTFSNPLYIPQPVPLPEPIDCLQDSCDVLQPHKITKYPKRKSRRYKAG